MNGDKKFLFLSNGHGEDQAAAAIIKQMQKFNSSLSINAMPFVGEGRAYCGLGTDFIDVGARLPSGGFMRLGIRNLIDDLRAGLIKQTLKQISVLKKIKRDISITVVCGDLYLLLMAKLFVGKPIFFYAAAKSELINGHFWIEKYLIRVIAKKVYTRDEPTAINLKRFGINAVYLGNPCLPADNSVWDTEFYIGSRRNTGNRVCFLPGSREDAYSNIEYFLEIINAISENNISVKFEFNISICTELSLERIKLILEKCGVWSEYNSFEMQSDEGSIIQVFFNHKTIGTKLRLFFGGFHRMLKQSDIAVGLSGTGNEQAAALGIPVVAFPIKGRQYNSKFMLAQKKLLGDCLAITTAKPQYVANKVIEILQNQSVYQIMAEAGIRRMGIKGGAEAMARDIQSMTRDIQSITKDIQ